MKKILTLILVLAVAAGGYYVFRMWQLDQVVKAVEGKPHQEWAVNLALKDFERELEKDAKEAEERAAKEAAEEEKQRKEDWEKFRREELGMAEGEDTEKGLVSPMDVKAPTLDSYSTAQAEEAARQREAERQARQQELQEKLRADAEAAQRRQEEQLQRQRQQAQPVQQQVQAFRNGNQVASACAQTELNNGIAAGYPYAQTYFSFTNSEVNGLTATMQGTMTVTYTDGTQRQVPARCNVQAPSYNSTVNQLSIALQY